MFGSRTGLFQLVSVTAVLISGLTACQGASSGSGSLPQAGGMSALGTELQPPPKFLPVIKDTNPSTANLFLGEVCDAQAQTACQDFATTFRHGIALGTVYTDWSEDLAQFIDSSGITSWPAENMTPNITWMPEGVSYADINAGKYDAYMTKSADELKAFGSTIFLRPFHEFNGTWYTWSLRKQGTGPSIDTAFIDAWIRMVNIFRKEGATNVKFMWVYSSSALINNKESWNWPAAAYPGDQYVDWIGFDVYNRGSENSKVYKWETLDQIVKQPYNLAVSISANKPLTVAETASNEYGDGGAMKAAWIQNEIDELTGQNGLTNPWPNIRLLSWFDTDIKGFQYVLDSSAPVESGFISDIRAYDKNHVLYVRCNGSVLGEITSP